jgi:hypothetical protein
MATSPAASTQTYSQRSSTVTIIALYALKTLAPTQVIPVSLCQALLLAGVSLHPSERCCRTMATADQQTKLAHKPSKDTQAHSLCPPTM